MATELMKHNGERGVTTREEFGSRQVHSQAETAAVAVTARERAVVEAQYIIAERHPRTWMDVRAAMLSHCSRPRFAEIARYAKPIGKEKLNGQWVDKFARGFTVRFAETLTQEMGNIKPETAVTFEDDLIRIIRISVTDLEKNIPRSREVTIAKAVEKRGKKNRAGEFEPPEGREVISSRINSYGEPTYLVRATDDELRNRVNSEESKTQRDLTYKLCPRDILEDCEDAVRETNEKEDKRDPQAATKKLLDRFHEFGLMPSDIQNYVGKPIAQWTDKDRDELRHLGAAIRDGQTTFDEALRAKYMTSEEGGGDGESDQQRDARLQRQSEDQLRDAKAREEAGIGTTSTADGLKKITQADIDAELARKKAANTEPLTDEQNKALDAEIAARDAAKAEGGTDEKPLASSPRKKGLNL